MPSATRTTANMSSRTSTRSVVLNTVYTTIFAWLICSHQYTNGASSDMRYSRPNIRKIKWSREAPIIKDAQPISNHNESTAILSRRLLVESCSKADIAILQGQSSPMPSGIPTFSVQIFNMCVAGCSVSHIHIACGWFASANLVNPNVFRRIKYNDCLVNNAACTSRDISISQSRDDTEGIPQFIVQIINTCTTGCTPSNVHVSCGWFASAGTINPRVFTRIAYNDCLVNGGGPLPRDGIVRFTYSNSFMYPLNFKSASFC